MRTKRSLASAASTVGQGWFDRHEPSISRAATPATRTFGPSAHQTGPSPSQTAVGVHLNVSPAGTTCACASDAGGRKFEPITAIASLVTKRMRSLVLIGLFVRALFDSVRVGFTTFNERFAIT
jgi:hypothetical protein